MMIWGKVVGGFFGWMLLSAVHMPLLGLLFGVWLGNRFDRAFKSVRYGGFHHFHGGHAQAQEQYFELTFSIMGYLAKSDGVVSEHEIAVARRVMDRLGMDEAARRRGISAFSKGKSSEFDLDQALLLLRQICAGQIALLRLFVEVQTQIVAAEGRVSAQKSQALRYICQALGVGQVNHQQYTHGYYNSSKQSSAHHGVKLKDAYQTLEISSQATDDQVKRAYRKLMGQYHPDRLVAKGLPEEMMKVANQKTSDIKRAYETIRASRRS